MKHTLSILPLMGLLLIANPSASWAQAPAPQCTPPACKVCVREPKTNNTRKVYLIKEEEYCVPYCSLKSLFRDCCGCTDGECGELRIRHRLVVKKIPACDTTQCIPKEVKPKQ